MKLDDRVEVWFGEFDIGEFTFADGGVIPTAIVHEIHEQIWAEGVPDIVEQAEDYADRHGHAGFLIPAKFEGSIVFSKFFFKRLGA